MIEQVNNVCNTTIVKHAWARGAELSVHGWIYGIKDGILKGLVGGVSAAGELDLRSQAALDDL